MVAKRIRLVIGKWQVEMLFVSVQTISVEHIIEYEGVVEIGDPQNHGFQRQYVRYSYNVGPKHMQ